MPHCLPRQRRPPHRLGTGETAHTFNTPEPFFHQQYFEFFDIVCSELKHRCQQERGMPVAAALEKALLDATTRQTTLTDDSLSSVLQMYNKDVNIPQLVITLALHCHFE